MEASEVRERIYGGIQGTHDVYANVELLPPDFQGWSESVEEFEKCIRELQPKIIIEVGTWKGWSAFNMTEICLKYYDDFQIVCVDTWLGSVEHWMMEFGNNDGPIKGVRDDMKNGRSRLYELFLSNVVHKGYQKYITPFAIDSTNAAYFFYNSGIVPDMVYIDAGHEYQSVRMDLYNYSKILRPNGYLLGDDWHYSPIKQAANETFGPDDIIELSTSKFLWKKNIVLENNSIVLENSDV
jgi:hypothetical protein